MIFVTVGSQKFQFNRLLKKIDEMIENGVIREDVFAQIGASDYKPKNFGYTSYLNGDEFKEYIKLSDIVITHGGTGAIMGAVKQGKKVVAIPRLKQYGEHVDDHQIQLLQEFDKMNLISTCYKDEDLKEVISSIRTKKYNTYESNTNNIIYSLKKYINEI